MRFSAGSASLIRVCRPIAEAPSWISRGPAPNQPSLSRSTNPELSRVRRSRSAVLGGSPARRAHSDRLIDSSAHTSASRARARSTVRVDALLAVSDMTVFPVGAIQWQVLAIGWYLHTLLADAE